MYYLGAHTSISGALENAARNAFALEANAFAMFTKNQRQWKAPALSEQAVEDFKLCLRSLGFGPSQVLPHDSYLINLGTPDPIKRANALDAFIQEMERCRQLGLDRLNFHPGAHLNQISIHQCLSNVAHCLDSAIETVPSVMPVIETTSGQGSNVGSTFEEVRDIIGLCKYPDKLGVCIDTCHIFAAGYELRTKEAFLGTFDHFDKVIGFGKLRGMHLNDCKSAFSSHVDRHEGLGRGNIGKEPFTWIMQDRRFENIPLILETPHPELWKEEIAFLRKAGE